MNNLTSKSNSRIDSKLVERRNDATNARAKRPPRVKY